MAIADDFDVDVVNRRITYTTAFVDARSPTIYTVNELYDYLSDLFDEPAFMQYLVPMSAQTPTQYTLINSWYMDDESMKALYGGSIQTSGWLKVGAEGVTQIRWADASLTPPDGLDIGVVVTGGTSTATGVILAVNEDRQVAWLRNTSAAQFADAENITGGGTDFDAMATGGVENGNVTWANLFSVGSLQPFSEIYVGQEDDYQGGRSYHTASPWERRLEKLDEWWDSDVDFASGSPNLLGGPGHFDILVKTREAGTLLDGGRLVAFVRQFTKVYSHFPLTAATPGNFPVPFASTGADLNSQVGPYTVPFDARSGDELLVGDVLENDAATSPEGRLRAVVTAVTGGSSATGTISFYLIGENEPLLTTDRTLKQLANDQQLRVRFPTSTCVLTVDGTPTQVVDGPAQPTGITYSFANFQSDVDEDGTDEEYTLVIDCNERPLADVYRRGMFLTARGNQDGTTPDSQDELLPSAAGIAAGEREAAEFYRGVGDVAIDYISGIGTQVSEGDYVINVGETASGVVVSGGTVAMGVSGILVLTQVKGTFSAADQIARPGDHATNRVVQSGSASTIAANTGAPFGAFAGGRYFFARGVLPINVPAADANNWETTDLSGSRRAPPTVRTITFAGLTANDRGFIAEVNTAGDADINKNQNGVGAAGAAIGATVIPLDASAALDVPTTGFVRVVDDSSVTGEEYRYRYVSTAGAELTLETGAGLAGTTTSLGSATVLNDTGAFAVADFGTPGFPRIGMEIRNVTDGSRAVIVRRINDDSIETTPLVGGTLNVWGTAAESWAANVVVVALVDADTLYFPFIDDVAAGSTLSTTVKYVANKDLIARARFSSPLIGGQRILPFEQRSITLQDANLTVTAIRTADPIAP